MWTFLLDPATQGVLMFCALAVLGFVVLDLYQSVTDAAPTAKYPPRRDRPSPGAHAPRRAAPVEPMLEAWTDAAGETRGRIRRGPCAGRRLEEMSQDDCEAQAAYAHAHEPSAAAILESYMRRRFARPPPREDGAMTRAQALRELGLVDGASAGEIHAAWVTMIKRHHPDHGGSHAKAARINQAKDWLTG